MGKVLECSYEDNVKKVDRCGENAEKVVLKIMREKQTTMEILWGNSCKDSMENVGK